MERVLKGVNLFTTREKELAGTRGDTAKYEYAIIKLIFFQLLKFLFSFQCLGFLSKIDEIIQYIEKGLSPGEICKKLGFCPKAKIDMNAVPIKPDIEPKTSPSCEVCDSISKTFGKEMKDYKNHAEKLQQYLIEVCRNTKQPHIQEKVGCV